MGKWDDFKREEEPKLTGKKRCVIVSVEESVSAKGNDMIVIGIRPSGCRFTVRGYLVKNDRFNRDATAFFDAFPEIEFGNFSFVEWVGAEGAVNLVEDDRGYLKIKNFIDAVSARDLPPFEGDKPERQTLTSLEDETEDDSDSFPF